MHAGVSSCVRAGEYVARILLGIILVIFVTMNALASQYIPVEFQSIAHGDTQALITVFAKLKDTPLFGDMRGETEGQFYRHRGEIFAEEEARAEEIARLEGLLATQPASRDILLILAKLYAQRGDDVRSQEYLFAAQEIDPQARLPRSE